MKRLLLAATLLAAPFAALAQTPAPIPAPAPVNPAAIAVARTTLPGWPAEVAQTRALAAADPQAQVVWLGDSITYYWHLNGGHGWDNIQPVWEKYYAPYHGLALGIIGDTTSNLIWRMDHGEVDGLHPKLVIILIGANNFGRLHWGASMTVPGIEAAVADAQKHMPQAHIVVLGVLPSIRSPWVDQQTEATNAALAAQYKGSDNVTFVDVGYVLKSNGKVDTTLFFDPKLPTPEPPLHPNATGMGRIAAVLAPLVRQYTQ
jgi:lysophospholipase L1-like esterase